MKVTLTIEGDSATVLAVMELAIDCGVLTTMTPGDNGKPAPASERVLPTKAAIVARFAPGTQVRLWYNRTDRPNLPPAGTNGHVVEARVSGRGAAVTVQWGDQTQDTVPSSMLHIIRRPPTVQ